MIKNGKGGGNTKTGLIFEGGFGDLFIETAELFC